jgi:hypothetical protein
MSKYTYIPVYQTFRKVNQLSWYKPSLYYVTLRGMMTETNSPAQTAGRHLLVPVPDSFEKKSRGNGRIGGGQLVTFDMFCEEQKQKRGEDMTLRNTRVKTILSTFSRPYRLHSLFKLTHTHTGHTHTHTITHTTHSMRTKHKTQHTHTDTTQTHTHIDTHKHTHKHTHTHTQTHAHTHTYVLCVCVIQKYIHTPLSHLYMYYTYTYRIHV